MLGSVLLAGLRAVGDYIALHVLTCLIPAFLLAGAASSRQYGNECAPNM